MYLAWVLLLQESDRGGGRPPLSGVDGTVFFGLESTPGPIPESIVTSRTPSLEPFWEEKINWEGSDKGWLGEEDSNPRYVAQSHASYR